MPIFCGPYIRRLMDWGPCACDEKDALRCARARYGRTYEPCDCCCHDETEEVEGWEDRHFYDLSGPPVLKPYEP